jgi:hypothetical protein
MYFHVTFQKGVLEAIELRNYLLTVLEACIHRKVKQLWMILNLRRKQRQKNNFILWQYRVNFQWGGPSCIGFSIGKIFHQSN